MKTKTRGLEPIVAAVLPIVVAVIGAVPVYLWFAGYVTKATSWRWNLRRRRLGGILFLRFPYAWGI